MRTVWLFSGAVKLEETCPAGDKQAPEAAGGQMPDLVEESVKAFTPEHEGDHSDTSLDQADRVEHCSKGDGAGTDGDAPEERYANARSAADPPYRRATQLSLTAAPLHCPSGVR